MSASGQIQSSSKETDLRDSGHWSDRFGVTGALG